MTDSEAVRAALGDAAAHRRVRSAISEEARHLEADREEMRTIREQMAAVAPASAD